jgi:hypothetical protein
VVVLCFETETVRQVCCDKAAAQQWGPDLARCISRRLQQLEAMASLDDLAFMPFRSVEHPDGVFEVALDDDSALFMREVDPAQEDGHVPAHLVVITAVSFEKIKVV